LLARHEQLQQADDRRQRRVDDRHLHRIRRSRAASRSGPAEPRLDAVFAPVRQTGDERRRYRRWRAACRHPAGAKATTAARAGCTRRSSGIRRWSPIRGARPAELLRLGDAEPHGRRRRHRRHLVQRAPRLFPRARDRLCAALHDQLGDAGRRGANRHPGGTRRRGRFGARYLDHRRRLRAARARQRPVADARGLCLLQQPGDLRQGDRVYVVAECLEFDGKAVSDARSRMVVLRTRPVGTPSGWTWDTSACSPIRRSRARWAASG
jgi:hypothetical protein